MLKKTLRLIFKVLGTPFFLIFMIGFVLMGRIEMFFYWLYDADQSLKWEKEDEAREIQRIKNWFTKI